MTQPWTLAHFWLSVRPGLAGRLAALRCVCPTLGAASEIPATTGTQVACLWNVLLGKQARPTRRVPVIEQSYRVGWRPARKEFQGLVVFRSGRGTRLKLLNYFMYGIRTACLADPITESVV